MTNTPTIKRSSLPATTSTRLARMFAPGDDMDVDDLRFCRDTANRDGDLRLAVKCAYEIDKMRTGTNETAKK